MRGAKSPIRIEYGNAIETKTNTEGKAATELICGRLHFEAATDSLVIATLPDVIVLRLGKERLLDRMHMLVRAIHDELEGGRLGALAVATDLASALFVQMLRAHCERASNAGALRLAVVLLPNAWPRASHPSSQCGSRYRASIRAGTMRAASSRVRSRATCLSNK